MDFDKNLKKKALKIMCDTISDTMVDIYENEEDVQKKVFKILLEHNYSFYNTHFDTDWKEYDHWESGYYVYRWMKFFNITQEDVKDYFLK